MIINDGSKEPMYPGVHVQPGSGITRVIEQALAAGVSERDLREFEREARLHGLDETIKRWFG